MEKRIQAGTKVAEMNWDNAHQDGITNRRRTVRAVGVVREIYAGTNYSGEPQDQAVVTWFSGYSGTGGGWPVDQLVAI
jgi:hypothetical protein